ncbi:hypothetical protein BS17DRAFT_798938 [Gyrodon lividus]|nr:hypothetical protein BS17DRAFT_798938 [Gyrodon lividus]
MASAANMAQARLGDFPTTIKPPFGTADVRAPIPDITEPDDDIVKVTVSYEFMGKVDRVGPNVNSLNVGQRVFRKPKFSSFYDNTISSAWAFSSVGARDAGFFGYLHFVPPGEVNLLPILDDIPDDKVLYLFNILPTSFHCIVDTGGLGPIGQCPARWAKIKGAPRVICVDKVPERLALAKSAGFEVIDSLIRVKRKTSRRKYTNLYQDVVLDCGTTHEPKTLSHKGMKMLMLENNVPVTVREMIVSVRKMDRCDLIAVYAGFTTGFNISALMEKGLHSAFNEYVAGMEIVFVETHFSSPPCEGTLRTTRVDEWKN